MIRKSVRTTYGKKAMKYNWPPEDSEPFIMTLKTMTQANKRHKIIGIWTPAMSDNEPLMFKVPRYQK
jgi:hypothetical protein